jgi:hypothetical protein
MFYRNTFSGGSAGRYVRSADGRESWTSPTSYGPRDEMMAKYDGQCKLAGCGDRAIIGGETTIAKRNGQWNHRDCPPVQAAAAKAAPEQAMDDDRMMAEMEAAADRAGTERDNAVDLEVELTREYDATCDAADDLLDAYAASKRAAAYEQFIGRKLIYRVSLTGEAKRYGVDVVNVEAVPNAKYGNVKIGEFRGVGVGRVEKDGTIRYWNDVDRDDARVKAVVAAINILMNAADPVEYARAYALESKVCMRCGDDLVDDGNPGYPFLGPVCVKKFGKGE